MEQFPWKNVAKDDNGVPGLLATSKDNFREHFAVLADENTGGLLVSPADGSSFGSAQAVRYIDQGLIKYIAYAQPGTPLTDEAWRCVKVDRTDGIHMTFADGNANFDNRADDLPNLTYL